MNLPKTLLLVCAFAMTSVTANADPDPIKPVDQVDLKRFMGDWYVIGAIATWFEKGAYNAVETYRLQPDGRVATTFRMRKGSFDSRVRTYHSTGFVDPLSRNAVWGVQFVWPFKAQYKVAYLNDDYSQTIIARDARDYVWIMARTPTIAQADYESLLAHVETMGYPLSEIRKVPQAWPETGP